MLSLLRRAGPYPSRKIDIQGSSPGLGCHADNLGGTAAPRFQATLKPDSSMDPFTTFDNLRQAYLRYLDSPFWLRYQAVREERRQLLDQDRQLYREPMVEPLPPYRLSEFTVQQAAAN